MPDQKRMPKVVIMIPVVTKLPKNNCFLVKRVRFKKKRIPKPSKNPATIA